MSVSVLDNVWESVDGRIANQLCRTAYRAQQLGVLFNCLAAHHFLRVVSRQRMIPSAAAITEVQRRYDELLQQDLENVEAGLYPRSLLFQLPILDYLKTAPAYALDVPRTIRRIKRQDFQDFPDDVTVEDYPAYFRRNFHWQTDGYLSRRSADLYDAGVEFLFLGTADVMRRQVIPAVTQHRRREPAALRLLDVGCGTGRTLHQLAVAHPTLRYTGLDLSPYYLQHARELLRSVEHLSLVNEPAEEMPFRDATFDMVTSVYMFHELPKPVRKRVYREMFRVLRPGGLLVIEDSAQPGDAGAIVEFLERFSTEFHEPFYRGYLSDDIGDALGRQGFVDVVTEPCFVSKIVTARKPG